MTDRRTTHALRFLGIEVERKTDILAAAAFIISITSLIYQIVGMLRGPDIVQFPPEQLLFFAEKNDNSLHTATDMSYANKGREGANGVLKRVKMEFALGGKSYSFNWQDFEQFGNDGSQLTRSQSREPATPVVIKGGEVVTKEIHFASRTMLAKDRPQSADIYSNFLKWDMFVAELGKVKELNVTIISEFVGAKNQRVELFIRVTPSLMEALSKDKWDSPSCWTR